MKRTALLGLLAAVALAGCTGGGSTAQGSFELLVSDQRAAIGDFDSLTVTFSEARVFTGANDSMETFDISGEQVDLTRVQGTAASSILNASLDTGNYSGIQLMVSDVDGVVNGSDVAVKLPSERLHITKPFTVTPNSTTRFVFDIQVVLRGNQRQNQGYILKPVISESGVVGEDVPEPEEADEGEVGGNGTEGNASDNPERPEESFQ